MARILQAVNIFEFVGAAISRPVVFPMGKQRRRIAPTMQYRTFANEIRRYNVETWYILQHWNPGSANSVLLKKLPRWRADNIRPYNASKYPLGNSVAPFA